MPKVTIKTYLNHILSLNDGLDIKQKNLLKKLLLTIINCKNYEITLRELAELMGVQPFNLKRSLNSKSFIEGYDFKFEAPTPTNFGRPRENILLSVKCCKNLISRAKSKKSEQLMNYFIDVEDVFHKDEIDKLKKSSKCEIQNALIPLNDKNISPNEKSIYITKFSNKDQQIYKICTIINISQQYEKIQGNQNLKIIFYKTFTNDGVLEFCTNNLLKKYGLQNLGDMSEIEEIDVSKTIEAINCIEIACNLMNIVIKS